MAREIEGPVDEVVVGYLIAFGAEAMEPLAEERDIDVLDVLAELDARCA